MARVWSSIGVGYSTWELILNKSIIRFFHSLCGHFKETTKTTGMRSEGLSFSLTC